eukprot:9868504-Alexandrium_andersonii.AAC.1
MRSTAAPCHRAMGPTSFGSGPTAGRVPAGATRCCALPGAGPDQGARGRAGCSSGGGMTT